VKLNGRVKELNWEEEVLRTAVGSELAANPEEWLRRVIVFNMFHCKYLFVMSTYFIPQWSLLQRNVAPALT
jgi:hypothetical protein